MMTDPIADMLTRLRNALRSKKREVVVPFSRVKHSIANVLLQEKLLESVEKVSPHAQRSHTSPSYDVLVIRLKYMDDGQPIITTLKRISTPGRRSYVRSTELPIVLNNLGIALVSTSQGIMTNKEAKAKHLGGEVLCEVS